MSAARSRRRNMLPAKVISVSVRDGIRTPGDFDASGNTGVNHQEGSSPAGMLRQQ